MTAPRLFPVDDVPPSADEVATTRPSTLFDADQSGDEAVAPRPLFEHTEAESAAPAALPHPMTGALFTQVAPATDPAIESGGAVIPPVLASAHANAVRAERRRAPWGRIAAVSGAVIAVAAIAVAALVFVNRPATDALEPLRDAERGVFAAERNLTREQTAARDDADAAAAASAAAAPVSADLTGLIPEPNVAALTSAVQAVDAAVADIADLPTPSAYTRDIAPDADAEAVEAAVRVLRARVNDLESALSATTEARATLTLRMDALTAAANGSTTALFTAADTALAKQTPEVDAALRTAVSEPLAQLRPYAGYGVEVLAALSPLITALRALTTEQARLEAEEAERLRQAEEEADRTEYYYTPSQPASPAPTPAEPAPAPAPTTDPEPAPQPEPSDTAQEGTP